MTTQLRIGHTYLFAGYAKLDAQNRIQPESQALDPVRDVVLFTSDPGRQAKAGSLVAWKTDAKGLIYPISTDGQHRPTAIHYLGNTRRFHVPPPDVLLQARATEREKWADKLADLLAKSGGADSGVELTEIPVAKKFLRPPDRQSDLDAERAWTKFYDGLSESSKLSAYVLPKTRALLLVFSNPNMAGARVTVTPPGKKGVEVPVEAKGDLTCAVAIGTPDSLPAGVYTFAVSNLPELTKNWARPVADQRRYELKEQVRFTISNFAGDFDIVTCDPISVEESVMLQYPTIYGHLITAAKKRTDYPDLGADPAYKDFPKALEQWSDRLSWIHGKAKLAVGLINADSRDKRAKLLGKALWAQIQPDNELLKATRNSIDLAFQVKGVVKEWKELAKEAEAEEALANLKRLLWKDVNGTFEKYRWWKYVKEEYVDGDKVKILELASASDAERQVILRAGIPERRTELEELVGKKAGSAIQKGLVAAQMAIDVYKAALAFNDVLDARKELRDLQSDFDHLLDQVKSVLAKSPSREGLGNLERMRAATVVADQKLDEEEAKAAMAAVDVVLGALTLVGVGGAALAAIVLAKEVGSLGKEVVVDLAEWLDRVAFKGFLNDLYVRQWKRMADLARESTSNQSLMPSASTNGGKDDLHVQFRLRAEALHGLVGLFTRASVASKDEAQYLERVQKYRVAEYVKYFLLNQGWQFPLHPMVPISMDTAWMYLSGPFGAANSEQALREQFGFASPIKSAIVDRIPMGMTMLSVVDSVAASNAVANFHGSFPLHRMDEPDFTAFAKAFRPAWRELDADSIDYTCIYRRPADSTGDGGWQPINPKNAKSVEELEVLSPLDQIRILVVLKEEVKPGCYPISFQLYRTDGLNLTGPVYRDVIRRLDKDLLPSEKQFGPTKDRADGRMGCVCFPFYQVGKKVVPGIKPLAGGAKNLGVGLYELLGYLHDMRYAFKVKVGDASEGEWLKIGAANAARSELDEIRVGITGKPNEDRLLVADFLERESQEFDYPTLFQFGGFGPCYVRVRGASYQLATPEENGIVKFDNFGWSKDDTVEFIIVAWETHLAYRDWDLQQLDWTRVPAEMQLVNFTGWDKDGPSYASTLNYVGQLDTTSPALGSHYKAPDGAVAEWAKQVRGNAAELKKLVDAVDPRNFGSGRDKSSSYHVFAAHFALDYFTPAGDLVPSLRPFGHVLTKPDYYRIGVRNLRTAKKSGLEQKKMETSVSSSWTSGSGYAMSEYEFHFRAPQSHSSGVPWATLPENVKTEWIETEGTKRNPNVQLLKSDS